MQNPLTLDVLSIIVAVVICIYSYCKFVAFQDWKRKNVPYLEPTVPYGNAEAPYRRTMTIGTSFKKQYDVAKKDNGWKYFGSYIFTKPWFIPTDLDLVKSIMTKDFHNFTDRGLYVNEEAEPISAHLFAIGGVKWRNLRTKFTPTFTSGKMRMMFQTLVDCGVLLDETISELSTKNEPIDIKNVLGCFSTDIIGSCAFGLECNSIKEPNSPFRIYGKRIFDRTPFENVKFFFANSFQGLARTLGITIVPKDVNEFFCDVVKKTVEYREKNNVSRKDFLQILIDIKNNKDPDAQKHIGDGVTLTLDEMTAQSFVFFLAGFETSSTTMTFTLFELARNPEIQEKVRQEIHAVLKKHDGKVDYDSLKDMRYMTQVINETLRMYPPVPFVTRVAADEYNIPNTDLTLDKNTTVLIPIQGIHYDEEYYPEPEKYDPDRFSEEQTQQRHQYAHIPFGESPRICIGMRFGIMQTKVGLMTIIRNYKVSLSDKTSLPLKMEPKDFIPNVRGGIWLNIEKI